MPGFIKRVSSRIGRDVEKTPINRVSASERLDTIHVRAGCPVSRINWKDIQGVEKLICNIYISTFCLSDPGRCGYGLIWETIDGRKATSDAFRLTSVDRIEIFAAIAGLQAIQDECQVDLHTQSMFTHVNWKNVLQSGFQENEESFFCADLRQDFVDLCNQYKVNFELMAESGRLIVFERCDQLAKQAAENSNLRADLVFETLHKQGKYKPRERKIPSEETSDSRFSSSNASDIENEEDFIDYDQESDYYVYSTVDEDGWVAAEYNSYWDAEDFETDYFDDLE